jgi:hypothetical protein
VIYFLFLFSLNLFAATPSHWSNILMVTEQHEFYKNFEPILKPANSWQHLFSVSYIDRDLKRFKDCVFYKVPGEQAGILKIKTLSENEKCDGSLLNPGDLEVQNIKFLQYAAFDNKLSIDITFNDFKNEKWVASIQGTFRRPEPKLHLSSAEFKASKLIFLSPKSQAKAGKKRPFLKDGTICLDVNDDCVIPAASHCDQCENGWYEVPNGCVAGPKFCGPHKCGGKNQPACNRGLKWQRASEENLDCQLNSSFAYCSKNLKVFCEGKKAFCR